MDTAPQSDAGSSATYWPAPALAITGSLWLAAMALIHGAGLQPAPTSLTATIAAYSGTSLLLLLIAWQWPRLQRLGLGDTTGAITALALTAMVLFPVAFGATSFSVAGLALVLAASGAWLRSLAALDGMLFAINLIALVALLTTQAATLGALAPIAVWLSASLCALALRHWQVTAQIQADHLAGQHQKLALEKQRHVERMDLEARRRRQLEKRLAGLQEQLEKSLRTDPLTRLGNRQAFNETLAREFRRARREQQSIALMFCNIDAFRSYNHRLGNDAGDALIKRIAALIDSCIGRPADLVARYEGTVFGVVLPNTDVAQARLVGNRIRSQIEEAAIPHPGSPAAQHVTLSVGLSSAVPYADLSPERLMSLAAAALKDAKEQGRNRVNVEAVSAVEEIQPPQASQSPRHIIPPAKR